MTTIKEKRFHINPDSINRVSRLEEYSSLRKVFHIFRSKIIIITLFFLVFCFNLSVFAEEPVNIPPSKPLPALTGNAQTDFLAVAYSQLGYQTDDDNYSEYWIWAGSVGKNSWCGDFVAWCAGHANINHIIPIKWGSGGYRKYFAENNRYYSLVNGCADPVCGCSRIATAQLSVYELMPGDILLKETDNNMSDGPDHVGIFVKIEGESFYTIDGNVHQSGGTSGRVTERKYNLSDISKFHGVCRPDWNKKKQETPAPSAKNPQPMTVNKKTAKCKLKKTDQTQTVMINELFDIESVEGDIVYTKKKGSEYLSVNYYTGEITIDRNAPVGTHKIKVRIRASGNDDYLAGSKVVTVKVKIV